VPTTLPIGPAGLPQGELEVEGFQLAVAAAGMGNPHVVIPVTDLELVELELLGPALEMHPAFPARTNVHFVQVLQPGHLVMRVWERGAGPTLACGTGACATLAACHLLGLSDRSARLDLPGGPLHILWDDASGHLFMTGPAEAVFEGVLAPDLLPSPGPGGASTVPPGTLSQELPAASAAPAGAAEPAPGAAGATADGSPGTPAAAIDCSTACVNGCLMPQACASAEARARVEALLGGRSLDELVDLATNSLESRTRARFSAEGDHGG
jgi:diaminopimelate epimerase